MKPLRPSILSLPATSTERTMRWLAIFTVACVTHTLFVFGGLFAGDLPWPADRSVPRLAWIEQAVRGQETVGWVIPDDAAYDWCEFRRSKVEAAIAPTRLVDREEDVTLFLFHRDATVAQRREVLRTGGYSEDRIPLAGGFALGARPPRATEELGAIARLHSAADPTPGALPHDGPTWRLVLLALLIVIPIASAARHAREAAGLMAVFAAVTLSLVAGVNDALGGGAVLLILLWLPLLAGAHGLAVRMTPATDADLPKCRAASWLGLLALGAGAALWIIRIGFEPEGMLDAQVMFNLRARWILTEPSFWAPFVEPSTWPQQHLDYPPLVSFAVAGAWRVLGADTPFGPALIQVCLWLGSAWFAALWVGRRSPWAGAGVLALLAASPFLARVAAWQVADGPLAALLVVAFVTWTMSGQETASWRRMNARVAGAALGAAAWTKNEGLAVALLVSAGCVLWAWRFRAEFAARVRWAAMPLASALVGLAIFKYRVPANDLMSLAGPEHISLERMGVALSRLTDALAAPWPFRGVLLAMILMAFAAPTRQILAGTVVLVSLGKVVFMRLPDWGVIALLMAVILSSRQGAGPCPRTASRRFVFGLVAVLGMFTSVYLMTPYSMSWQMDTSLNRVLAHVYAPASVALMLALSRDEGAAIDRSVI
jgi:hypothetical protein